MIFTIISVVVPIFIYFLTPFYLQKLTNKEPKGSIILLIACLLFFVSWYLPSPLIDGQHTQFSTHFVGGGLFTGFLWLYIIKNLDHRLHWFTAFSLLYFLVSGLGVANELFELFLAKSGAVAMTLNDTSWDLFANTLGAFLFWLSYMLTNLLKRK